MSISWALRFYPLQHSVCGRPSPRIPVCEARKLALVGICTPSFPSVLEWTPDLGMFFFFFLIVFAVGVFKPGIEAHNSSLAPLQPCTLLAISCLQNLQVG